MTRCATMIALCAALSWTSSWSAERPAAPTKMIILGVDGLDPKLLSELMAAGRTPNLARLAASGGFVPLGTSTPPQSPVAWSNFITGMDSGQHGVFDFLHFDRTTLTPYSSMARVRPPSRKPLAIGRWRIPLASGETEQLREGPAFWELLEANGVRATLFQMPANYPPVQYGRALSGMGTPDMKGTSGTFAYYTEDPDFEAGAVSGGVIHRVARERGVIRATLEGPPNAFLEGSPFSTAEFTVRVDRRNPVALIELGEERTLLNVGEWSEWLRVDFPLAPAISVPGMVRFHLRETTPHFALYASPVNIDPRSAAQAIAFPAEYASDLASAVGPFYTEEMPEDAKALSARVLEPREFLAQSALVLEERKKLLEPEVNRFARDGQSGLLFFYFSTVDQRHHMLARQADPEHPFHEPDTPTDLASSMSDTYARIDALVGWTMDRMESNTTLVVMSDHGFAPFRRQAHLNAWLEQHGYLTLAEPQRREEEWLKAIDWSRTRAFAIGLNSLYLNVRGRQRHGIVPVAERTRLAREIAARLSQWRDPESDEPVVAQAALREDVYHGPRLRDAPDIIVGYARGYRASWPTTTGVVPTTLLEDNKDEWSGDHCMDPREVPGVLIVNRPLKTSDPDLMDLTASVLAHFNVKPAKAMRGRPAF